jgi:WW domain-containing oxidoreductase
LGDLDSIAAAVDTIRQQPGPIDAIVANAGIAHLPSLHTRYGVELQFLVNYIGHFALINALLDRLRDGSGRIVLVSSAASRRAAPAAGIMFDNLAGQQFYDPAIFYGQSKFANAAYAFELARRLKTRGIGVNAAEPGAVRGTRLAQHMSLSLRVLHALASPFMKSAAQGAATAALLAASPAANGISGEYWANCRRTNSNPLLQDVGLATRLWAVSEQIIASRSAAPAPVVPQQAPIQQDDSVHRAA